MIRRFNIKYRPQIESGEYKVRTSYGKPARIVCWDKRDSFDQSPVLALITDTRDGKEVEYCVTYTPDGQYFGNNDHFLVVDDGTPNLSELEKYLIRCLASAHNPELDEDGIVSLARDMAKELPAYVGEELKNDFPPRYSNNEPIY